MDFLKAQFDKVLLTFLYLVGVTVTLILISYGVSETYVTWGIGMTAGFIGALTTLITGSRFTARSTDTTTTNGGGSTTTSTTTTGEGKK